MRYISPREENWTWLILAGLWAVGGIFGWLYSCFTRQTLASSLELFLAACLVTFCGLALRLPVLTGTLHTEKRSDQLVVLLGCWASVNWLGLLLLHAGSVLSALPALLVVLLSEAWLCFEFDRRHGWPWSLTLAASGERKLGESPSSALDGPIGTSIQEHTDSLATGGDDNADENQTFVRRTREGIADGQRFLSGEIHLKLSPDERSKEVVIGFCPAFEGEPCVEFELTDERVSGNLLNCSPGGMRLIVRRNPGEQPEELGFDLQWYAAQSEPVLSRPTSLP